MELPTSFRRCNPLQTCIGLIVGALVLFLFWSPVVSASPQQRNSKASPSKPSAAARSNPSNKGGLLNKAATPKKRTLPSKKAQPKGAFQLAVPTRRATLLLMRFQRLQEVIRMLDWAVKRGWLENLDIDQLKQVNQWLSGRLAKMMGIQWSKGLWLRIRATNRKAQALQNWPDWLPRKYQKYQSYSSLLKQLEIVVEIPIKKTFWLSFALKQLLGLAKVPFYTETLEGYATYWLHPPQGIPAVLVVSNNTIFVRLLWPHQAFHSKVGRAVLWRFLVQPSLLQPTSGFKLGKKRLVTNFPSNTIIATYISVEAIFSWLKKVKSDDIAKIRDQLSHINGFALGGVLTLTSLNWKTMQWFQKRKAPLTNWVLSANSEPMPDVKVGEKSSQHLQQVKPKNAKLLGGSRRSKPERKSVPPPKNLPLPNPLWKKKKSPAFGKPNLDAPQPRSLTFSTSRQIPLPLNVVTWPSPRSVFVGYFSKGKGVSFPQSSEIRRLKRQRYQQPVQLDVFGKVIQSMESYWGAQSMWIDSWVGRRQLSLWMLETTMLREWMLWGYLPRKHSHKPGKKSASSKSTTRPSSQKTLTNKVKRARHVRIAAIGRWDILSAKLLQQAFTQQASKVTPMSGQPPILEFVIAKGRSPMLMTWRGLTWMMAESKDELQRLVRLHVTKARGKFLSKLPTNSLFYQLQQNPHWNVLQLKPSHLHCLLQRSSTGQLASLITQKVTSLEMAGLRTPHTFTLELQLRWDVDKVAKTQSSCEAPSSTWRHTIPALLATYQQSMIWQLLDGTSRLMKWREMLEE